MVLTAYKPQRVPATSDVRAMYNKWYKLSELHDNHSPSKISKLEEDRMETERIFKSSLETSVKSEGIYIPAGWLNEIRLIHKKATSRIYD